MVACANCGSAGAKSHCSGCFEAPTVQGTRQPAVTYCGKECQRASWSIHRNECKRLQLRKALFRAGSLLQKIWDSFRRESFDNDIVRVEEVDGTLLVHEGDYDNSTTKRYGGFYREFPESIFENKRDEETALNLLYCSEALGLVFKIVIWLLKDICEDIKETLVMVSNPVRRSRYVNREWHRPYCHAVLTVKLKSGEQYAIDLTGAQYGWHDPVTEWSAYARNCISETYCAPLGRSYHTLLVGSFDEPGDDRTEIQRAIPVLSELLKRVFENAFVARIISRYPRALDVLKLPNSALKVKEQEIIAQTKQITIEATEKLDSLFGVIIGETAAVNERLLRNSDTDKVEALSRSIRRLIMFYEGEWSRSEDNGVLVPHALDRFFADDGFAHEVNNGVDDVGELKFREFRDIYPML